MNESRTESALWCVCTQLKFMHKAANTSATEGSTHSCNLFRNPKFYRSRHGITRYHREPSLVSEFVEVVVMLRCLFFAAALVCAAAPADYFQAIRAGDAARLKACITAGGVNEPDSRQTTPLHYAAAIGNVESVRLLLSAGAKANVVDNAGGTPLLLAATSAEKIGLLNQVVPSGKLLAKAIEMAQLISENDARMVQGIKRLLHENIGRDWRGRYDNEQNARKSRLKSNHPREGFKEFLSRKGIRN